MIETPFLFYFTVNLTKRRPVMVLELRVQIQRRKAADDKMFRTMVSKTNEILGFNRTRASHTIPFSALPNTHGSRSGNSIRFDSVFLRPPDAIEAALCRQVVRCENGVSGARGPCWSEVRCVWVCDWARWGSELCLTLPWPQCQKRWSEVCVFKLVFILVFSIHFFQSLVFLYVRNFQLAKFCERD